MSVLNELLLLMSLDANSVEINGCDDAYITLDNGETVRYSGPIASSPDEIRDLVIRLVDGREPWDHQHPKVEIILPNGVAMTALQGVSDPQVIVSLRRESR